MLAITAGWFGNIAEIIISENCMKTKNKGKYSHRSALPHILAITDGQSYSNANFVKIMECRIKPGVQCIKYKGVLFYMYFHVHLGINSLQQSNCSYATSFLLHQPLPAKCAGLARERDLRIKDNLVVD